MGVAGWVYEVAGWVRGVAGWVHWVMCWVHGVAGCVHPRVAGWVRGVRAAELDLEAIGEVARYLPPLRPGLGAGRGGRGG